MKKLLMNIANLFVNKSLQNQNVVNINESIEIMKILDMWKLSLL